MWKKHEEVKLRSLEVKPGKKRARGMSRERRRRCILRIIVRADMSRSNGEDGSGTVVGQAQ